MSGTIGNCFVVIMCLAVLLCEFLIWWKQKVDVMHDDSIPEQHEVLTRTLRWNITSWVFKSSPLESIEELKDRWGGDGGRGYSKEISEVVKLSTWIPLKDIKIFILAKRWNGHTRSAAQTSSMTSIKWGDSRREPYFQGTYENDVMLKQIRRSKKKNL